MPPPELQDLLDAVVAALPAGSDRPGQRQMAEAVEEALGSRRHLLAQAGTGTGKSIAYLLPALTLGKRVIISTSTKALQSQLVDTDIPRLLDIVEPLLGRRPSVAILKGRNNYLCQAKLHDTAAQDELPTDLAPTAEFADAAPVAAPATSSLGQAVLALREWATTTDTGDQADVPAGLDPGGRAFALLSVSSRECVGKDKCGYAEVCFAETARSAANESDLVVTNHSLLALGVTSEGSVLPAHAAIVIDEAHDFADRVTSALSEEVSLPLLDRLAQRLAAHVAMDVAADVLAGVSSLGAALSVAEPGRVTAVEGQLELAVNELNRALTAAGKQLQAAAKELEPEQAAQPQLLKLQVDTLVAALDRVSECAGHDVVWVERSERRRPSLHVAPLHVAKTLSDTLLQSTTVVATSATLTAGGGFSAFARRVGLTGAGQQGAPDDADNPRPDRWHALDVGSPFEYDKQAVVYVAAHLPDPSRDRLAHASAVREHLLELVRAAGGRTLALFTSMAAATEAAAVVRAAKVAPVLLQGDEPLGRLVELFKSDPRACLFGTMSLWQGVDVPGSTCHLVVIDKLPFPRPDDPLAAARADAAGSSGFLSVFAAHAAVMLAQGTGRLIRSTEDRGVVAILDPRVDTKRYGQMMLDSLPPMRRMRDPEVVMAALRRLDQARG